MKNAYNVVRDWNTGKILFRTRRGLGVACDWMMSRIDDLDIVYTSADEILENGDLGGSWFITDLLENNPDGWTLPDGTVIKGKIDIKTLNWVITKERA